MIKKALGSSNVPALKELGISRVLRLSVLFLLLGFYAAATDRHEPGAAGEKPERINYTYYQADSIIRGKVTNREGQPLAGVSVTVRGTQKGAITDAAGEFQMSGVSPNATLEISSVGFENQQVKLVPGRATLAITLREEADTLKGVVVTGFQTINKRNFTGAAVKLRADEVKIEGITDVSRMLEGRAAGVSVQSVSGTFGAAPKIRIRGATSISGENKPLWVIDGVVLEDVVNISNDQLASGDPTTLLGSAVAGLNANDIESFDILKDAAATALYGARAMNGVIVITTKRGKAGKPAITYTGNFSYQLKPTYRNYDIMNSLEQMSVYKEIYESGNNLYISQLLNNPNSGVYGKMYDLIDKPNAQGGFEVENTPEGRAAFLSRYAYVNTDWFDLLFRHSLTQEHALSISSGTDKGQSYFSTSFYHDNGWTIADKVNRYTANFRNNYRFSDRMSAGFIITGSVRQQRAPGTISRVTNPVEGSYDRDFDINPFSYSLNTSRALTAYDEQGSLEYFRMNYAPFNIINELRNNYIRLNVLDLKLQGDASYKITRGLRYEFFGALRFVKTSQEHQITENSNMAQAYRAAPTSEIAQRNKFLYRDPANPNAEPVVVLPYGGFYNRTEDQLVNYTFRNVLNYTDSIGSDHLVTALAGQEVKYADRQNASNTGFGYQYGNGGIPFVDYRIVKQYLENNFQYYGMGNEYDRFVGFFGNGSYTYKGKYTFNGTVRVDGSNRLGNSPSSRWLPTWTLSGKWNVDREPFMDNIGKISSLTLRASYGLNASYGAATNSTVVLRSQLTKRASLDDQEAAIALANLENADLTWEKKYEADIGTDIGLFNNRLNITADVYHRNSFDLISLVKTSGIGGEVYKPANYADVRSQGVEFTAGGKVLRGNDWDWSSNLTFGYNTSVITDAKHKPLIFNLITPEGGALEGYPVRGLFSLRFAGLNHDNGVAEFVINEKGDTSYAINFQSDTTSYLKYEGPVDPTMTGGFSNTFRYKNLSLSFLITGQAGNKIRLTPVYSSVYSDLDVLPGEFKNRWSLVGDEAFTNIPSIADLYLNRSFNSGSAYPYNNYNYSDARVVDGSFVRLKTVSLMYSVPARAVQRYKLGSLSVTLVGNNLWLIYSDPKLHGQDPEFFNAGGVALPVTKQFVLSLKVGI